MISKNSHRIFVFVNLWACITTACLMFMPSVQAAPGDILFSDNFESGSLATNWTENNSGGGDAGVSSATANSGTQSMFTRWDAVSVTSNAIDTTVPAATLTVWVRRGADSFSEDPDNGEDLVLEYLDSGNNWITFETFTGSGTAGEIFSRSYSLTGTALHANLQLRLRQTGGNGGAPANGGVGWDYWHIDDVIVTEVSPPVPGAGFCDDFESGLANWTVSNGSRAGISSQTSNSPSQSLYTRHGTVNVTSQLVDMSAVSTGLVSAWIRRGSDSFSEDPDGGENLVAEYVNNVGTWIAFETFSGSGTPGEIFTRSYAVPADGFHTNFQLRFRQTGGSGSDWDYWHVDDVCITPGGVVPSSLLAYYAMDEAAWNGSANEVQDGTGNGYNGASIGINGTSPTTSTISPAIAGDPGTCGYGEFPFNSDANIRQAVDTGLDMNTVGNSGTISFWYKSNEQWNGNRGNRMLLDASTPTSGQKYFFVMLRNNSRLRFALEDSNDGDFILDSGNNNFVADEWVHVAVTWDLPTDRLQIYINGSLDNSNTFGTNGVLGNMGSLHVGDNRSNYLVSGATGDSANGSIDELRIYSSVQTQAQINADRLTTHPCSVSFDHLRIEHDGSALTCEPESVTVRACLNASCSSEFTGDVAITLTPTGWSGGDNKTVTGGSGTFQLPLTVPGAVTLGISTPSPSPANGVQCLNTATSTADCTLTYYDTGFIYSIPTQTSCTTSSAITISAVRLDDTSQACIPTFVSQTRDVIFSLAYASPGSGTRDLTLNYNATNYTPIDDTTSQTVPISFDASGRATFTVTYPDAGQITLISQYTGSAGTGDAGLSMSGSTTFITIPAKMYVYSDDTDSDCAAGDETCSAFKKAGENFNLKIRAACSDNTVTPNFQLDNITVAHSLVAPSGGAVGTLGVTSFNISDADNGEHTITNQTISEVGVFTFNVADFIVSDAGSIYNGMALTGGTSVNVGRFYPDHFCMSSSSISNRTDSNTAASCTDSFSFLDEDFDAQFTLTAQAVGSSCGSADVTQNYTGTFTMFSTPFSEDTTSYAEAGKWNLAAVNDPTGTPADLSSRIDINTTGSSPANGQFTSGQLAITARIDINRSGAGPGYTAETSLTDARIGINPVDTDSVTLDNSQLTLTIAGNTYAQAGNTSLYFGRLFAENAYGTNDDNIPLQMWTQSQYCNAVSGSTCSDWQPKTDDSCTLYSVTPPADTALGGAAVNDGDGYYQRASPTVSSSVFDFTASSGRVHVPDTNGHSAGWQLFYTGAGTGGDFVIPFTVHPYLLNFDGTASFGLYRGDDRIIYWREVLE